jgi:osmoprotectant transport system ATP-binding protein
VDARRPGQVYGLGSTFDPETDSLRAALDAALTSPVGVAVAVVNGRYAGVVGAKDILAAATVARAAVADTVSVRSEGVADGTGSDLPYATDGSDAPTDGPTDSPAVDQDAAAPAGSHALAAPVVVDDVAGPDARASNIAASDTHVFDAADSDTHVAGTPVSDSTVTKNTVTSSPVSDTPVPDTGASGTGASDPPGSDVAASATRATEPEIAEAPDAEPAVGSSVLDTPSALESVARDHHPRSAAGESEARVGGSHPLTDSGVPARTDQPQPEETQGPEALGAERPTQQHPWMQGRQVNDAGQREHAPAGNGSDGRGSEEPGAASDEFDGVRSPWNPFKRPQ